MLNRIRDFVGDDRTYFQYNKSDITAKNYHMLIDGCVVYAVVLLFYTVMTSLTEQSLLLRSMYYIFDVLHIALCIMVFERRKRLKTDFRLTQLYCALQELSLLGFFALEGAFTSRTQHSLYIPIALLLVLLLFIHDVIYTGIITFVYLSAFTVLSCVYKTPEAYTNDIYIAIATLISAVIGYTLIARLRFGEAAALRKYESLSRTDALTGLYNKSAVEALCERALGAGGEPCAFLIIDLDDFKSVNDTFGHDAGDEVLGAVGRELRDRFRGGDYIGRFGGDEFVVLMNGCGDENIAAARAERVVECVSELRFTRRELRVSCSVGVAMHREGDAFRSIFKRADRALYEAKADGKRKYRVSGAE